MSIGIFEFDNFVKFDDRIDVCLAFCCKYSCFSIVLKQFADVNSKNLR